MPQYINFITENKEEISTSHHNSSKGWLQPARLKYVP